MDPADRVVHPGLAGHEVHLQIAQKIADGEHQFVTERRESYADPYSTGPMVAHEKAGSGPPLLLIHGLGSCKEVWKPVVPLLARQREVVTLDLPGFGSSPPGAQTVEGLADAVLQFAADLGIERPHVAGNSMGGGTALALAATDRVRSACAVSPIGFSNDREVFYARALLASTRALATMLAPVAEPICRPRVVRAAFTGARCFTAVAATARGGGVLGSHLRRRTGLLGPLAQRAGLACARADPADDRRLGRP